MSKRPWHFAATGQALIKRDLRPYMKREPLAKVISELKAADAAFTNFEGTISGSFGGWPTKNKSFSAPGPYALDSLEQMGFNMLSLCNNHAFDLGPGGILSTLEQMRHREILHAGIGVNAADAAKPMYHRFAFGHAALIAADCGPQPEYAYAFDGTDTIPSRPGNHRLHIVQDEEGNLAPDSADADRFLNHIAEAAEHADFVVVYLHSHHWEPNAERTPEWMRTFAKRCIDHGAHAWISHGVPIVQGIEIYKQRPIFYSLGNFIFHTYQPRRWQHQFGMKPWQSVIAHCHYNGEGHLNKIDLQPVIVGGDAEEMFMGKHTELDAPILADHQEGHSILERIALLCDPLYTHVEINGNTGTIIVD